MFLIYKGLDLLKLLILLLLSCFWLLLLWRFSEILFRSRLLKIIFNLKVKIRRSPFSRHFPWTGGKTFCRFFVFTISCRPFSATRWRCRRLDVEIEVIILISFDRFQNVCQFVEQDVVSGTRLNDSRWDDIGCLRQKRRRSKESIILSLILWNDSRTTFFENNRRIQILKSFD